MEPLVVASWLPWAAPPRASSLQPLQCRWPVIVQGGEWRRGRGGGGGGLRPARATLASLARRSCSAVLRACLQCRHLRPARHAPNQSLGEPGRGARARTCLLLLARAAAALPTRARAPEAPRHAAARPRPQCLRAPAPSRACAPRLPTLHTARLVKVRSIRLQWPWGMCLCRLEPQSSVKSPGTRCWYPSLVHHELADRCV